VYRIKNKEDLNKISLTGARALIMLGLLTKAPRSFKEIKETFVNCGIMDKTSSFDTLRIDLNTLKSAGCDISRSSSSTNFKYVLKSHPYLLNLTEQDADILRKTYKKIKNKVSISKLIQFDMFFKKLAQHISDEKIKDLILGISVLKTDKIELLKELMHDCSEKNTLTLNYASPYKKLSFKKNIIAKEILFRNDKIYLLGYDEQSKESNMLKIDRIQEILQRKHDNNDNCNKSEITVKFKLKSFGVAGIEETEKIIETYIDGYLIEGKYHNEFLAIQRILSFGSDCTVLEPDNIKQSLITKLKSMREIYND